MRHCDAVTVRFTSAVESVTARVSASPCNQSDDLGFASVDVEDR